MPKKAGLFIVFEGGDGAGKSTQAALLASYLEKQRYETVVTREPGGTELGKQIRQLLLHGGQVSPRAEAMLYAADRAQHIATLVRPALARGAIVIQDRYIDSSVAYQGAARELGESDIRALSSWATEGLQPHLTVVLDIDPSLAARRRIARGVEADRLELESLSFHQQVRQAFLRFAAANPANYLVLNAQLSVEQLQQAVQERVQQLLK